jgi:ABC-type phosphate/phosphonate transport system substrate-binding protein
MSPNCMTRFGFYTCSLAVNRLISLLVLFAVLTPWSTPSFAVGVSESKSPYIYGVFPYLPVNSIEEIHAPIAKRFSEILGRPVKAESRPTFKLFRDAVENKRYDIIYIQPFGYIRSAAPNGYVPIARFVSAGDTEFKGTIRAQFVTLSNAPIDRISQLENSVVAMPSAEAAVSVLGVEYLKQHGLFDGKNIEINYHENHFSCLQQLIIHKASACVSALPAIQVFEADKKVPLKIFATTQAIPSSLIAVQQRVPDSQRLRLQQDIIGWQNTPQGEALLRRAQLLGFIPTTDRDYDIVRDIWKDVRGAE